MDWRIETVETGAASMDCLRFGCGTDSLVILPGASVLSVMGAAEAIVEAYAPLTGDFEIFLLDYRKVFPDSYSVQNMARDAYEALRALELDRVCLFGASLGGMAAMTLAAEHSGYVRKLALGSTAARVPEGRCRLFERWEALAVAGDARGLCLSLGEAVYPSHVFGQIREQLEEVAGAANADDLTRFAVMMRIVSAFDAMDQLNKITCPVLAIGSRDDRVLGVEGTLQIAERLGDRDSFEMHLYDGYGHAAYDTAPDYKDRLLRFFAG